MEHILTHTFLTEWKKIQSKLDEISNLGLPFESGEHTDGYDIEESGITVKSSDSSRCGCCIPETYSFHVLWEDINKPIEWFKEQAAEYNKKESERKQQQEKDRIEWKRNEEINKLKELQSKYPNV